MAKALSIAKAGSLNTWFLWSDEVRYLMDWWNWHFQRENEAMAHVQTQHSWRISTSLMSQDQINMMPTWWFHHESSELFLHGEIESGAVVSAR